MPLLLIGALGVAAIGGSALFSYEAGQEAGQGLNKALTIIGVATGVGIVIYAMSKSGVKI
jgi:hypothetical protein